MAEKKLHVDRVEGPAVFVFTDRLKEVPDEKGRDCPQCDVRAWKLSRFCWHCGYDFDRVTIPRLHPVKLLAFSVLLNALSAGALAYSVLFTR